jgi:hypothetical protein
MHTAYTTQNKVKKNQHHPKRTRALVRATHQAAGPRAHAAADGRMICSILPDHMMFLLNTAEPDLTAQRHAVTQHITCVRLCTSASPKQQPQTATNIQGLITAGLSSSKQTCAA